MDSFFQPNWSSQSGHHSHDLLGDEARDEAIISGASKKGVSVRNCLESEDNLMGMKVGGGVCGRGINGGYCKVYINMTGINKKRRCFWLKEREGYFWSSVTFS